ncbi:MAG: transketolase family protein [Clostridia bacterium]|nr:transketolase family protein [Clostridia bacterium]
MNSKKLIATRESFGNALADLEDDRIVVLDADLSSSTKTDIFEKKYPERFIENGIAEADMIGTAAGLASCDKIPFVASFAAFATGRCYDQIRASIAYPKLNVKICGTHSGITVGEDGATHQMLEDLSLMRTLPNMTVISPSDDVSTRKIISEVARHSGPTYVRLSRMKTPIIYAENEEFEIGKGKQIGNGKDATIFATGDVVCEAIKAQEFLKTKGINVRVVDMYSIKPIDKELVLKCAEETNNLISIEDHSIIGGLGSAIAEILCDEYPKKLVRMGINDTFGKSGTPEQLLSHFKIDANAIIEKVKEMM